MTIQNDENRKKTIYTRDFKISIMIFVELFFINNYFKITERDYRVNISNFNIESSL
jgi:hypothetical protein